MLGQRVRELEPAVSARDEQLHQVVVTLVVDLDHRLGATARGVALVKLRKNTEARTAFQSAAKSNPKIEGIADLWEDVAAG